MSDERRTPGPALMFLPEWQALLRVLVAVPLLYVALVAIVRISGKRTTSQLNNFDWIVTVAVGSIVATGVLSKDVSIVTVVVAVACFLALQYAVTWLVIRSDAVRRLVKATPRLLVYDGRFLWRDMCIERISELEVRAALRAAGHRSMSDVHAVVLETDATLTVLPREPGRGGLAMLDDTVTASADRVPAAAQRDAPGRND